MNLPCIRASPSSASWIDFWNKSDTSPTVCVHAVFIPLLFRNCHTSSPVIFLNSTSFVGSNLLNFVDNLSAKLLSVYAHALDLFIDTSSAIPHNFHNHRNHIHRTLPAVAPNATLHRLVLPFVSMS